MIPLLLFLLALLAIYVGTIETAFSALMRLSLRLVVERGGRDDKLGFYLDDPIRLFLPARLLLGLIFSLATMCIALLTGRTGSIQAIGMLILFVAVFIVVCEHVIPVLIARRNPERVLEVLLPPFDAFARVVRPLTNALTRLIEEPRRERPEANGANGAAEPESGETPVPAQEQPNEERLIEEEGRKLLQSIVDFGDKLVREVMTPRPDMVAIPATATLAEARLLFQEQEYSRIPVYGENLDNILMPFASGVGESVSVAVDPDVRFGTGFEQQTHRLELTFSRRGDQRCTVTAEDRVHVRSFLDKLSYLCDFAAFRRLKESPVQRVFSNVVVIVVASTITVTVAIAITRSVAVADAFSVTIALTAAAAVTIATATTIAGGIFNAGRIRRCGLLIRALRRRCNLCDAFQRADR